MKHGVKILFLVLLAGALSASHLQKVPQHDAAAAVKLVTVRVLDRDGRPVTDLRKEDFILFDNGKKQTITEFEVHTISEEGMKVSSPDKAAELAETVEGMNRRIFIFLDIQGSDINGMANAKKAALHFVDTQLRPGDEVGILGFSRMTGFFIQEYLTTDHDKIRKAIEKAKEVRPSEAFTSGGELDDSIRPRAGRSEEVSSGAQQGSTDSRPAWSSGSISVAVPSSRIFQRQDFVPRMVDLAEALKYIPGNKSLVLFTARNLGPTASSLGKAFAGASTPVYTVNTQNWIMQGVIDIFVKKKHIYTDHPMQELSLASGGKYFADIEDVETISRDVQALTGNFYVLGYYVAESWDGAYHKIKVEIEKPGLRVLAQDGYFNPKPYSLLTDFEKQLHLLNLAFTEEATPFVRLDAPVEPLFIAGREETNCVVLARVAVDEKSGIPPAKVEIFAFLFDMDGEAVLRRRGEVDLAPFDKKALFPYFTANLPAGEYESRIVTRDMLTGQAVVGKTAFTLPEEKESDVALSSPLLFALGPDAQVLSLSRERNQKDKKEASLGDFYRFHPKNYCIVVREVGTGVKSLLAVIPANVTEGMVPEVTFSVRLLPKPEGEPVVLSNEIVDVQKAGAGAEILVMEIALPEVEPGEYELEIEAVDKNTLGLYYVRKSLVFK